MFQALRNSNQIYVLHKEASPYVEVGSVVNVTPPAPQISEWSIWATAGNDSRYNSEGR